MSVIVDLMDVVASIGCSDPEKQCSLQTRHKASTAAAYAVFFVSVVVVMHKFTDGDFSVVLTMSAAVQCLGFFLLSLKVKYQRTVAGLSSRTLEMYVVFFLFRLGSTLFKNGYLPVDRSGDYIYQLGDIGSLVLVLHLLYCVHRRHKDTYQSELDTLQIFHAIPACILLAVFVHGDLNNSPFFDTVWTVSLFLDTICLLPQLWMMTRLGGLVESLTSHFVAAVIVSRCLSFAFWLYGHKEIAPLKGGPNIAGYVILTAHSIQLLLCADFMYYYMKGMSQASRRVVLPTFDV